MFHVNLMFEEVEKIVQGEESDQLHALLTSLLAAKAVTAILLPDSSSSQLPISKYSKLSS